MSIALKWLILAVGLWFAPLLKEDLPPIPEPPPAEIVIDCGGTLDPNGSCRP